MFTHELSLVKTSLRNGIYLLKLIELFGIRETKINFLTFWALIYLGQFVFNSILCQSYNIHSTLPC